MFIKGRCPMQLELIKAEGGKMIAVLPQEIADLPAKLEALQKSLTASSARLAETDQPKDDEIAHLKEEVTRLESPEHAQEVFIDYARKLDPEGFVKLAEILGFEAMIPQASMAEVAESEKEAIVYEEKPSLVTKDPHDTAYIAYPSLGIWVLGVANDSTKQAEVTNG